MRLCKQIIKKYIYTIKNKDCKPFTYMVQGVFITPEPCYFNEVKRLKSQFFSYSINKR